MKIRVKRSNVRVAVPGLAGIQPEQQEALAIEFVSLGIPFVPQVKLQIYYKGQLLRAYYQPDFVCYDSVIVELKAISALSNLEDAILLNYLKATPLERGLLLNFATPSLEFKRSIFSNSRKQSKQSPTDLT